MQVPRSMARQALGFRFRGFSEVGGGRSFGDKIAIFEGYDAAKPCCASCASKGMSQFGIFSDDGNLIESVSTNTFGGGAALFVVGLAVYLLSSRKKGA